MFDVGRSFSPMNAFSRWLTERTARWGLPARIGVLLVVTVLASAAAAAWRYSQVGPPGILAGLVAGGICFAGAGAALLAAGTIRGGGHAAVSGMLLGMLFRMGLPLAALMMFQQNGGTLQQAGIVGCLLLVYPVTLLAEVALALPLVQSATTRGVHHPTRGSSG
jgi:hypothetical protein